MPKGTKNNWLQLATDLSVSRTTIYAWRKLPGAPTTPDPEEWREFVEKNTLGGQGELGQAILFERHRKLKAEAELKEIELSKARGETVQLNDMTNFVADLAARVDQVLTQSLDVEMPPRLEGKSITEMRIEIRKIHDEVREKCDRLWDVPTDAATQA